MNPRPEIGQRILDCVKEAYPESRTLREISKAVGIQSCSVHPWIDTLLSSRDIEISGKKGRSNLYRFVKA